MLEKAIEVAVVSHAGQTDKNGDAYILHPLRVMFAVRDAGGTMEQQAAAVLHDVIEDCDVPDDFLAERFPEEVCDLVDALTKIDGEDYESFLRRAARTSGAVLIKEADVQDNYARLHLLQDEALRDRLKTKYEQALLLIHHLSPTEERRGFYRITLALGEALVLCTMSEVQVLRVVGVERGLIKYRVQNQSKEVLSQLPIKVRLGEAMARVRIAMRDSRRPYVEVLVDELSEPIRIAREARITFPEVMAPGSPDLPTPHLVHLSTGEFVRFKGPDASMASVQLSQFNMKKRSLTLEINKRVSKQKLYETVPVKLSGGRLLLQAHPGATEESLRLFAVVPSEIVVSR